MGASNGRTKRSIEDNRQRQRRQTGAQTDRQTLQALELIRRAFRGEVDSSKTTRHFEGSAEPFGRMGSNGWKRFWVDDEAVNHFGDVGSAWPYDPQTTRDRFYGPEDKERGRGITVGPHGSRSWLSDYGSLPGGYHSPGKFGAENERWFDSI